MNEIIIGNSYWSGIFFHLRIDLPKPSIVITPKIDSQTKGVATQRITAITIKQENIATNKSRIMSHLIFITSSTILWPV